MKVEKRLRSESGASAVEFALLLPVLMMVLFGIIEFGFALYQQAVLTNASREGARVGIVQCVPPACPDVNTAIDNYLNGTGINPANVARVISPSTPGASTGTPVTVTLTLPYQFMVLPNLTSSVAPQIKLTAYTVMRHE